MRCEDDLDVKNLRYILQEKENSPIKRIHKISNGMKLQGGLSKRSKFFLYDYNIEPTSGLNLNVPRIFDYSYHHLF